MPIFPTAEFIFLSLNLNSFSVIISISQQNGMSTENLEPRTTFRRKPMCLRISGMKKRKSFRLHSVSVEDIG